MPCHRPERLAKSVLTDLISGNDRRSPCRRPMTLMRGGTGPRTYDSLYRVPVDFERLVLGQAIGSALDPEMEMRHGRVPAVSDQSDPLSRPDALPTPHAHRAAFHVRITGVKSPPDPQEHAVASEV